MHNLSIYLNLLEWDSSLYRAKPNPKTRQASDNQHDRFPKTRTKPYNQNVNSQSILIELVGCFSLLGGLD